MIRIDIAPLSVNEAWQGRRFKTPKYKQYEKDVLFLLPKKSFEPPFKVTITFGFSSKLSDIDNPLKPILDIVQKKYGIDDKDIWELNVKKVITKKKSEFIEIEIEKL